MYVVDIDTQVLWETYLKAFPEGTDTLYKTETHHTCNCCRSFIKQVGNVVIIKDNKVQTLWDGVALYPYDVVSKALHDLVKSAPIKDVFSYVENKAGKRSNVQLVDDGQTIKWNHFYCVINAHHRSDSPESVKGKFRSQVGAIKRSLEELSQASIETVLELTQNKSLYRGTDNVKKQLENFLAKQIAYKKLPPKQQHCFVWNNGADVRLLLRNTSIGQLLLSLTKGEDLAFAVAAYERMVAPTNYRRTTALITKGMVEKALQKLDDEELKDSIYRRYAIVEDISARDILWSNRATNKALVDPLEALLAPEVKTSKVSVKDAVPIHVDKFLETVLPKASKLEVLFVHKHCGNLMSLTTATDSGAPSLFKWENNFAWTYRGEVADSIKERVKSAGGNVTGWGRASLSWFNKDDLDLHAYEPNSSHIFHGDKAPTSARGMLDVDMNVHKLVRDAVENIVWPDKMREGSYKISVHNYTKRESIDVGFEMELAFGEELVHCVYEKAVASQEYIDVAEVLVNRNLQVEIKLSEKMRKGTSHKEEWGIKVGDFHEVNLVSLSPNYWGEKSGLQHCFFFIDGCNNPESARGFYNEFLRDDLHEHRKVFEILGAKTKCEASERQVSGLGFSSTTRDDLTVRVDSGRKYIISF